MLSNSRSWFLELCNNGSWDGCRYAYSAIARDIMKPFCRHHLMLGVDKIGIYQTRSGIGVIKVMIWIYRKKGNIKKNYKCRRSIALNFLAYFITCHLTNFSYYTIIWYYYLLAVTTILLSMGLHIEYYLYFHDIAKIKYILAYVAANLIWSLYLTLFFFPFYFSLLQ